MPYDHELEQRIARSTTRWKGLAKKKMFGGLCYLLNGHMAFGVYKDFLIIRTTPEITEVKLRQKHTAPFDITGKAMKGWVMVAGEGFASEPALKDWLSLGRDLACSLPPK